MKKQINLICSILALFCFISMYMPVIAPRYAAGEYYAPAGSYESSYFYDGEYYLAKDCWSITDFVFAFDSIVARLVISLDQALLLLWSFLSVKGESGKLGISAALINLVVVGVSVGIMMGSMWSCRWGVLIMTALIAVMSVVMSVTGYSVTKKAKPSASESE